MAVRSSLYIAHFFLKRNSFFSSFLKNSERFKISFIREIKVLTSILRASDTIRESKEKWLRVKNIKCHYNDSFFPFREVVEVTGVRERDLSEMRMIYGPLEMKRYKGKQQILIVDTIFHLFPVPPFVESWEWRVKRSSHSLTKIAFISF